MLVAHRFTTSSAVRFASSGHTTLTAFAVCLSVKDGNQALVIQLPHGSDDGLNPHSGHLCNLSSGKQDLPAFHANMLAGAFQIVDEGQHNLPWFMRRNLFHQKKLESQSFHQES